MSYDDDDERRFIYWKQQLHRNTLLNMRKSFDDILLININEFKMLYVTVFVNYLLFENNLNFQIILKKISELEPN